MTLGLNGFSAVNPMKHSEEPKKGKGGKPRTQVHSSATDLLVTEDNKKWIAVNPDDKKQGMKCEGKGGQQNLITAQALRIIHEVRVAEAADNWWCVCAAEEKLDELERECVRKGISIKAVTQVLAEIEEEMSNPFSTAGASSEASHLTHS